VRSLLVYTITQTEYGTGYTTPVINNLITDFEVEIEENGECGDFTLNNIPKVRQSIERLTPVEEGDAGTIIVFGPFIITAGEMSKEELEKLPEFDGW